MELCGVVIAFMQSGTERMNVIRHGCRTIIDWHIETMYEINKLFFSKAFKKSAIRPGNGIPSHMRYFILVPLRNETFHISIKNTQAIHIPLFRVAAHQLHAQANAQYRLA